MADQFVEIVEYDSGWVGSFVEQRALVEAALEPWLAGPVEHVGSTSVPGLPAKPVVDMLAPVRSLEQAQAAIALLEADGWLFWSEDPNRHCRLWFLRPQPDARTHHLQVIEKGDPHARALLVFRDALRDGPLLCREYAQLKTMLAGQHRSNRNAYTDAKSEFVEKVLRGAGFKNSPARHLLSD